MNLFPHKARTGAALLFTLMSFSAARAADATKIAPSPAALRSHYQKQETPLYVVLETGGLSKEKTRAALLDARARFGKEPQNAGHRLGFSVNPLLLSQSAGDLRRVVNDAFELA